MHRFVSASVPSRSYSAAGYPTLAHELRTTVTVRSCRGRARRFTAMITPNGCNVVAKRRRDRGQGHLIPDNGHQTPT